MIRINLMPRAEARRQAARQRDAQIATLIIVALVATLAASEVVTRRKVNEVQAIADENQAELIQINKKHEDAILLDKKRTELRAKLETIAQLERQRTGPVHVMDDLSTATPEKLWLTEINEAGGAMTLSGKGLDNQTIASFMRSLAASRYFGNVDLVETKQIEDGQAKLKQFSIKASVLYAGRPGGAQAAAAEAEGGEAEHKAAAPADQAKSDQAKSDQAKSDQTKQAAPSSNNPLSGAIDAEHAAQTASRTSVNRNQAQDEAASEALTGSR